MLDEVDELEGVNSWEVDSEPSSTPGDPSAPSHGAEVCQVFH